MLENFFSESKEILNVATTNENRIYKREAFNAFLIESYPNMVTTNEKGEKEILPSKYESATKKGRKKMRMFLLDTLEKFLNAKSVKAKETFAKEFAKFYNTFYTVNDYSVESVTNGKMKVESISTIKKAFTELKALNTENENAKGKKK